MTARDLIRILEAILAGDLEDAREMLAEFDWPRCEECGQRCPTVEQLEHHELRDCRGLAA
jgi:hypothetical protein